MILLLKSSYIITYGSSLQVEDACDLISIHLGLLPDPDLSPTICFLRQESAVRMDDKTFFEVRKYFRKIDAFFRTENVIFEPITMRKNVIRAYESIGEGVEKLLCIEEYDEFKTLQYKICFNSHEWEQLVRLRDVLCLRLTILRKYSIYGRLVLDRLVNHLAEEPDEANIFQLPMDMICDHPYLKLNLSHYDMLTCQLLDAEIRVFLQDKIRICAKVLKETKPITFAYFYPFI